MTALVNKRDTNPDIDPVETREWLQSLDSVLAREGGERAYFILSPLVDHARRSGTHLPFEPTTAYVNTIPVDQEARTPGDPAIEWRIRFLVRWNALAMVVRLTG